MGTRRRRAPSGIVPSPGARGAIAHLDLGEQQLQRFVKLGKHDIDRDLVADIAGIPKRELNLLQDAEFPGQLRADDAGDQRTQEHTVHDPPAVAGGASRRVVDVQGPGIPGNFDELIHELRSDFAGPAGGLSQPVLLGETWDGIGRLITHVDVYG